MSKLTKGTRLYFIDPDDYSVVRVTKLTSFNPGGAPADQVEVTDLEELDAREYLKGLRTPGQASGSINANPSEASHARLHELAEDGDSTNVKWAIAWGDGTDEPQVDTNGNWEFPTTRTFYSFEAYVADFPLDFQLNDVVKTALTLQRSGGGTWSRKAS